MTCIASYCHVLPCITMYSHVMPCIAMYCHVLPCIAIYYQINSDLKYIHRWLKANKLSLNVAKTEFMVISSRRKLQSLNDYTMNIHIDGVPINQSNQSKSLGPIIDENLSWKAHIHEISKKVSSGIGALKRVRPFVSMHRQCTLLLKYTKVLSSHTLIIAALYGMA